MSKPDEQNVNQKSAIVYGAIFSLVISIIALMIVGWALDRWLKTDPWLLVAGIVVGSIAGFARFIRGISSIS